MGFIFQMLVWLVISRSSGCLGDKLSPEQKAPAHARSSAGRALALPGRTPANVGRLPAPSSSGPGKQPGAARRDDVQREETDSFKQVNGETVRAVSGNYGYNSPEGLPVFVKYMADENGNQASFSIGTGSGSATASKYRPSTNPAAGTQKSQSGKTGAPTDGDRKYLPPT